MQGFPVYVVAGRSRSRGHPGWLATVGSHLIFGVPSTLALLAITWTALVRTRREERRWPAPAARSCGASGRRTRCCASQRLEAVGQMTGGVAHDFNNLLTIILGSAEMLARRPDDAVRVRRVAEQIMLAATRGGEITQQLLAFSRRQFVNPQIVDLERLPAGVQAAAGARGQRVDPRGLTRCSRTCTGAARPGHFQAAC